MVTATGAERESMVHTVVYIVYILYTGLEQVEDVLKLYAIKIKALKV